MSLYNRILPESEQLLFTQAGDCEENTACDSEKDNEEVQSLNDIPDSQPFFYEAEKDILNDKNRKIQIDNTPNKDEFQLVNIVSSKYRRSNYVSSSAVNVDYTTRVLEADSKNSFNETEAKNYTESEKHTKNRNQEQSMSCIDCIFDKDLDKRNYYFGNLLIGELQFLPPCMRSEAYVTILKYVDSLKQKHRERINN